MDWEKNEIGEPGQPSSVGKAAPEFLFSDDSGDSTVASRRRQFGSATIRVEVLSLRYMRSAAPPSVYSSGSSESSDTDEDESGNFDDDDDHRQMNTLVQGAQESDSRATSQGNAGGRGKRNRINYGEEESSLGGNGERRKKNRQAGMMKLGSGSHLPRFACPYQAVELFRDCLKRGPRNRQGGCKGIYRLKYVYLE